MLLTRITSLVRGHGTDSKGLVLDFKQFLTVLRRRWKSIVAIVLVAVAISSAITFTRTPMYESRAQVFLSVDVRDTTDAYAASLFASGRASSYADLASSTELAERVIEKRNLDQTPEQLANNISAEVIESTSLIEIKVRSDDAQEAEEMYDEIIEMMYKHVR